MAFSFGAPAAPQPAATSSLFGSAAPAASPFGASAASAAPKPFSFGAPAASAAPAAAAGTSFFGQPQQAAAPASAAPSLFGQPPAASAAPTLSGGLFGSAAGTSAAPAAGGLFGQPAQGAQTAAPGAFSFGGLGQSNTTANKPSFFGAASQPAQLAQPQPQPQPQAGPSLSKHDKFNDLPDNVRAVIEGIDSSIRAQIQVADTLKTATLGNEVATTTQMHEASSAEAAQVAALLAQDHRMVADIRAKVVQDLDDIAKATALIEGYKNQQQKGAAAKQVANFPFEYFARKADEFATKIAVYRTTMDQIQGSLSSSLSGPSPSSLLPTLRAQHQSFMALASHVAALDLALRALKEEYRSIWRERTASVQDPFRRKQDRAIAQGVEGIAIR